MKTVSTSALATSMCNLNNRYFGGAFSSVELNNILKAHCGIKGAKDLMSNLENHGVVASLNARKCRFIVAPTEENIKNLI